MSQCPRCFYKVHKTDKVCPKCHYPLADVVFDVEEEKTNKTSKREEKRLARLAKKEAKLAKKKELEASKTDFVAYSKDDLSDETSGGIKKRYKRKQSKPQFEVDENGEFNIDTKDVEIVGEETGKLFEEKFKQSYSVKKERGEYREPKIKWWEIYKLADRAFARRKIKKEVNKAGRIKPDYIVKSKLLLLAVFFGWIGAHNFYAKNKRKAWTSVICFVIQISVFILSDYVPILKRLVLSVCGLTGFIVLFIWITDVVSILFNSFTYRRQKEAFIFSMNIKTRAKLGEKYIDEELYYKPWPVRFKVWLQRKKRNYEEWRHERRQAMIEKQKAKLEREKEKAQINKEIAEYEAKEEKKLRDIKSKVDARALQEVESLDDGEKPTKNVPSKKQVKKSFKTKNKKK